MKSNNAGFQKPSPSVEKRVESILQKLTLEEKIDLLGGEEKGTKEIPGKFPKIRFADGPVGVHWWCDKSTAYPALIQLAATWDRNLSYRMGEALGYDCLARGVHVLLAPGVNIYRSAFCGRNFEYLGEDPKLSSEMVVPYIKGLQDQGVAATVKHYALNFQEYDRHHVSSDCDERTMREIYLPAFEAAVKEAGAGALMTSYNLVNGRHASEHDWLINDVLKGEWAFDGLVMSDWVSVYSDVGPVQAGLDLEMPFGTFMNREKLLPALKKGLVTKEMIDDKVRRLIRLAVCFGWLDRDQKRQEIPLDNPETVKVALDIAREGTVLLKNEGRMLPLSSSAKKRIAVVGYHAGHPVICGGGSAYTDPYHNVTLMEGLKALAGDNLEFVYAHGTNPERNEDAFLQSEFTTVDGKPGVTAEYFKNGDLTASPDAVCVEERINHPWSFNVPVEGFPLEGFAARWSGFITPKHDGLHNLYLKAINGTYRLTVGENVFSSEDKKEGFGVETVELKTGVPVRFELEFKVTASWKMIKFGWEYEGSIHEEYKKAVDLARGADAVILSLGFTKETEGEGRDRDFSLPSSEKIFMEEILGLGKDVIAVVYAGGNIEMASWISKVRALIYAWYPGQEGGTALAEIIFGKINPSGKLPATFEVKPEDRSSFDNYHDSDKDKRVQIRDGIFCGYRHVDKTNILPLFPFGFGLSYTQFRYENLKLSSNKMKEKDSIKVIFELINAGEREGSEVCQLYISDVETVLPRPVKELKGFEKVFLKPGERKRVEMKIDISMLRYFNPDRKKWMADAGEFKVRVGASSLDIRLEGSFWLV